MLVTSRDGAENKLPRALRRRASNGPRLSEDIFLQEAPMEAYLILKLASKATASKDQGLRKQQHGQGLRAHLVHSPSFKRAETSERG